MSEHEQRLRAWVVARADDSQAAADAGALLRDLDEARAAAQRVGHHNIGESMPIGNPEVSEIDVATMEYRGNSVAYWHQKAVAYKKSIGLICDALVAAGMSFSRETNTSCVDLIGKMASERDELRTDAERYRWLLSNAVREKNLGDRYIEFHCDFESWNDVSAAIDKAMTDKRPCTCSPDDATPQPCARKSEET